MKTTIIPAGYRLTVTSWENDADNYRTKTIEGLTKEFTVFAVALCGILESKNGRHDTKNFGNMYEPSEGEIEEFNQAIEKLLTDHQLMGPVEDADGNDTGLFEDADHVTEGFLYRIGLFGGGDFFTRVCESFKVEHVPVAIEINDVTSDFCKSVNAINSH